MKKHQSKKSAAQRRYGALAALAKTQMDIAARSVTHALKAVARAQARLTAAQQRRDEWIEKYDDTWLKSLHYPPRRKVRLSALNSQPSTAASRRLCT